MHKGRRRVGGNGWTIVLPAETTRGSGGRASRGALEAQSDGRGLRPAGADVGVVNNHSDERREEPETRRSPRTSPTRQRPSANVPDRTRTVRARGAIRPEGASQLQPRAKPWVSRPPPASPEGAAQSPTVQALADGLRRRTFRAGLSRPFRARGWWMRQPRAAPWAGVEPPRWGWRAAGARDADPFLRPLCRSRLVPTSSGYPLRGRSPRLLGPATRTLSLALSRQRRAGGTVTAAASRTGASRASRPRGASARSARRAPRV